MATSVLRQPSPLERLSFVDGMPQEPIARFTQAQIDEERERLATLTGQMWNSAEMAAFACSDEQEQRALCEKAKKQGKIPGHFSAELRRLEIDSVECCKLAEQDEMARLQSSDRLRCLLEAKEKYEEECQAQAEYYM